MSIDLAGVCTGPGPCDTTPLGTGKNWLRKVNGLPDYIRAIAHSLRRDHGMDESRAIATAIATVKRWAVGGGNVSAETRARAVKAVAEWEAKKAASHALTATPIATIDLAADPVFATTDGPNLTVAAGPHRYHHGWIRIDAAAPSAVERASRAVATDGHALLHGQGMVAAAHKVIERVKAAGHRPRVQRMDVAGVPHVHIARTVDLTAAGTATVDLTFTENLHPRAPKGASNGGKFVAKNSSGSSSEKSVGATYQAQIRDFQKRAGLPVTGKLDTATRSKMAKLRKPSSGGGSSRTKKAAAASRHTATATAVNRLSTTQREQFRILRPTPPPGYHWDHNNRLVKATPQSRRIRRILGLGK